MISITLKTSDIVGNIKSQTEKAGRAATAAIWVLMRQRIFFDGLKANGQAIGTYSAAYLRRRQKPPYNRTSDPKKILVLTDSLRLNFVFDAISKTEYAIGINGSFNYQKAQWNDPNNEIFIVSNFELQQGMNEFNKYFE